MLVKLLWMLVELLGVLALFLWLFVELWRVLAFISVNVCRITRNSSLISLTVYRITRSSGTRAGSTLTTCYTTGSSRGTSGSGANTRSSWRSSTGASRNSTRSSSTAWTTTTSRCVPGESLKDYYTRSVRSNAKLTSLSEPVYTERQCQCYNIALIKLVRFLSKPSESQMGCNPNSSDIRQASTLISHISRRSLRKFSLSHSL